MSSTGTVSKPIVRHKSQEEPPYIVLVHNDDVTPFDFVIGVLRSVFVLSEELAEHIAWEAHNHGQAPVVTRPRSEAEALVVKAHGISRANGYPLSFSAQPSK
jgi:ATP-dependent Clp protease adaptor protein ClpS